MHTRFYDSLAFLKIDWHELLFGSEKWDFLPEVAIRTVTMFLIILIGLRMLGKRSVSQLSVFELGVIIGLGSAAGDPMFYKDVGLLAALVVFVVVIILYRFMTFLINRSERVEKILEGEPVYLIEDGKFNLANFENEPIAQEEFFAQLRLANVSHLGQLQLVIIETNGLISLFYYEDDEVKWGLPILPHLCSKKVQNPSETGKYACAHCGEIAETKDSATLSSCKSCDKNEWVVAIRSKRIA
ncbi:MAG: YetF domain-containing protein [Bacteroidota bacterium]